jgi:leucyl/phenylalanyl-tRNA--protein transferase
MDTAFSQVIDHCAARRQGQAGTWITPGMRMAYQQLHELGHAHSVECWQDGTLAGGLYGVTVGRIFFGESMFSRVSDASKVAFVRLVQQLQAWEFPVIDCQVHTLHLESLGAALIPRYEFVRLLDQHCVRSPIAGNWKFERQVGI